LADRPTYDLAEQQFDLAILTEGRVRLALSAELSDLRCGGENWNKNNSDNYGNI
jgi:hypothetical protein